MLKVAREADRQRAELRRLIQEGLESPATSMTSDDVRALIHQRAEVLRAKASQGTPPKAQDAVGA